MRDAVVPQSVAMTVTGHRTDAMWRRYNITEDEQKREALEKTQQHVVASAQARKVVTLKSK
jgi:hypothetical protein